MIAIALPLWLIFFQFSSHVNAAYVTLEEAILHDIIGDVLLDYSTNSKCNPDAASGTFGVDFTLSPPYFDTRFTTQEENIFLAQLTHTDPHPEKSWSIRIGQGGNVYSYRGPLGESMPPNDLSGQYMVDEVWQSVAVDTSQNQGANHFIHQAGVYQKDSPYTDDPYFFSPSVAHHCDMIRRECIFASWGQHAHVPTKFISKVIYINRYRDCGDGVLEFTSLIHNGENRLAADMADYPITQVDDTIYNYMSFPWWGIRETLYRDVLVKNLDSASAEYAGSFPPPIFDQFKTEMRSTGGYTLFAEAALPRPSFTFPGYTHPGYTASSESSIPDFIVANLQNQNVACGRNAYHTVHHQTYNVFCRWNTTKVYAPRCPGCELTLVNARTGLTLEVVDVVHWAYQATGGVYQGDVFFYFAPKIGRVDHAITGWDQTFGSWVLSEVNKVFTDGDEILVEWTEHNISDEENHAIGFVHGVDKEITESDGAGFWYGFGKIGLGTAYTYKRKFMVFNPIVYIQILPGSTYGKTQYIITNKGLTNVGTEAQSFLDYTIQDRNDVGDLPSRAITLYLSADQLSFGASVAGGSSCQAAVTCTGTTTAQPDDTIGFTLAHYFITCGSQTYFGPDVNYFSKFDVDGYIRTYVCDEENISQRPTVKLLGFFSEGACDSVFTTAAYDSTFCQNEGAPHPSASPSNMASVAPSGSPSSELSAYPTGTPTIKSSTKPSLSPIVASSDAPSTSPTIQSSVKPSPSPIVQSSDVPSTSPTIQSSAKPSPSPIVQYSDVPSISPTFDLGDMPSLFPSEIVTSAFPSAFPSDFMGGLKYLSTSFSGPMKSYGNMFNMVALTDITVRSFDIHVKDYSIVNVKIYTKSGSYEGSEKSPFDWILIADTQVRGNGKGRATEVPAGDVIPVDIAANKQQAFYVTLDEDKMHCSRVRPKKDKTVISNSDLEIHVGVSAAYYFWDILDNRFWDGTVHYTDGLSGVDITELGWVPDDEPCNGRSQKHCRPESVTFSMEGSEDGEW